MPHTRHAKFLAVDATTGAALPRVVAGEAIEQKRWLRKQSASA